MQPAPDLDPLSAPLLVLFGCTTLFSCLTLTFFLVLFQRTACGDATLTVSCSPATCTRWDC